MIKVFFEIQLDPAPAIWKICLFFTNSVDKARDFFQEVLEAGLGVNMETGNGDKTTWHHPTNVPTMRRGVVLPTLLLGIFQPQTKCPYPRPVLPHYATGDLFCSLQF